MRRTFALSSLFAAVVILGASPARAQDDPKAGEPPEAEDPEGDEPGGDEPEGGAAAEAPDGELGPNPFAEREPPRPSSPEARELSARGTRHYEAGNWREARADFVAAYEVEPDPELLFFIGDTYRREGHFRQALFYYHRFLETAPAGDLRRGEAESYADRLHEALSEGSFRPDWKERRRRAASEPRDRSARGSARGRREARATKDPWAAEPVDDWKPPDLSGETARSDRKARVGFWASLGGTAASVGLLVYSAGRVEHYEERKEQALIDASQDGFIFDADDACASAEGQGGVHARRVDSACDSGKDWATASNVFLLTTAVGAVLTGYFGYDLYLRERGEDDAEESNVRAEKKEPSVEPLVGFGSAGVRVRF